MPSFRARTGIHDLIKLRIATLGGRASGEAGNSEEALRLTVRKQPSPAVADIRMQGISRLDRIEQAKTRRPSLEFSAISEYRKAPSACFGAIWSGGNPAPGLAMSVSFLTLEAAKEKPEKWRKDHDAYRSHSA